VNASSSTIRRLGQHPGLQFLVHVGDVSYADDLGSKIEPDPGPDEKYAGGRGYEAIYDLFGDMVEPLTERMPYLVTPGNHDVSCHVTSDVGCIDGHKNFSAFNHRFRMPSVESGAAAAPTLPSLSTSSSAAPPPPPPLLPPQRRSHPTPASVPPPSDGIFVSTTTTTSLSTVLPATKSVNVNMNM
jgi:hypothetical protein